MKLPRRESPGQEMFERYTEKARRVIFFARYEASTLGSPYIEAEHLLLGVVREDKGPTTHFLSHKSLVSIRRQIEQHAPAAERGSTSVDLPMSQGSKNLLAYAEEEANRLAHRSIGTDHLLLGLLRDEKSYAAQILRQFELNLDLVRQYATAKLRESRPVEKDEADPKPGLGKSDAPPATEEIDAKSGGSPSPALTKRLMWNCTPGLDRIIRALGRRPKDAEVEDISGSTEPDIPDLFRDNDNLDEIIRVREAVRNLRREAKGLDRGSESPARTCEADILDYCVLFCGRIIGGQSRQLTARDRACLEQVLGYPIDVATFTRTSGQLRSRPGPELDAIFPELLRRKAAEEMRILDPCDSVIWWIETVGRSTGGYTVTSWEDART